MLPFSRGKRAHSAVTRNAGENCGSHGNQPRGFFPGADTPQDRETKKMLGELSEEEIRFLADIKKYSTTLTDDDKKLVLAMIRKMAAVVPRAAAAAPRARTASHRSAY